MNPIPDRRPAFILSCHDVAPNSWPLYRALLDQLPESLRCTLLLVPDFHGRYPVENAADFCQAMSARQERGDELVLHGYYHRDDGPTPLTPPALLRRRLLTHEGEFSALSLAEARGRIEQGKALCRRCHWRVDGFVPPGWVINAPGRRAVEDAGFAYYADAGALYRLADGRRLPLPTLVMSSRSAWRRTLFRRLNQWRLWRHRHRPVIRLALHPVDLRHPDSRAFWVSVIHSMAARRRCVTKGQWLVEAGGANPAFMSDPVSDG